MWGKRGNASSASQIQSEAPQNHRPLANFPIRTAWDVEFSVLQSNSNCTLTPESLNSHRDGATMDFLHSTSIWDITLGGPLAWQW